MKNFLLLLTAILMLGLPFKVGAAEEVLTVFFWSEYMSPEVIADFEKTSGIKVRMDYYESNEEMVAKLQSGGQGQYDIIVPSTYFITILTNLDLLQPLDHAKIPNLKNLSPSFTTMEADPGNKYTVPYHWGTSGLAVRSQNPENIENTWGLLYDPQKEIGGFVLFDTARDALGTALKFMGRSMNSTDLKEIEAAANLLKDTKKRSALVGFDGGIGGLNKVMSGVAAVAQVYNGDTVKASQEDTQVNYILPKEGSEIWTDLLAIPRKAPNAEAAHKFLNYLLEPEVAAKLANYNRYATPNEAAKQFISKVDLDNPAIYPSEAEVNRMEYMKDLGSANRIYDEAWTMIKTR